MITFLFIGGLGIALLLVSLVVGDVLEGALDFGGDLLVSNHAEGGALFRVVLEDAGSAQEAAE